MTDLDPRLTDESAQKVLARALELQAHNAAGLTVAEIREIAAELAIPEHAVDQALAEYRSAGAAGLSPRPDAAEAFTSVRRQPARPVVIALASVGGAFLLLTIFFVIMRLFVSS